MLLYSAVILLSIKCPCALGTVSDLHVPVSLHSFTSVSALKPVVAVFLFVPALHFSVITPFVLLDSPKHPQPCCFSTHKVTIFSNFQKLKLVHYIVFFKVDLNNYRPINKITNLH